MKTRDSSQTAPAFSEGGPRGLLRRRFIALGTATGLGTLPFAAPAAETPLTQRFAALYRAAAKEGQVIYYTDQRQETAQRLSAFWRENLPDVRLLITPIGSPALVAQVETERAAGQHRVDVTHMSQLYVAEIWKKKGFYQPYKTTSMARFAPDYADATGAYYSPEVYVLPVAYNTKTFPDRKSLPKKLADFLDPKWKGKMVLPDPSTSGNTLTFFVSMMAKGLIDWPYMEKLAKQELLFVRGNPDAVRMIASGERVLTPTLSSFNIMTAKKAGQAIDYYALDEGSIVIKSAMGIMAGTQRPNAARLLMEVLMSPEGQALLAEGGTFWPADAGVPLEAGIPPMSSLHPLPTPAPADAETIATFITRFKQVFDRR
ncbi:MAG: extracellular solute-binding protein [Pseudomonadota bacterium]